MTSLFQIPASIIETGLQTMNTTLTSMQSLVQTAIGQERPTLLKAPPLSGPTDTDTAVAEFANRLARIVRFTDWGGSDPGVPFQEIWSAVQRSFGYVDLSDPRNSAFPLQVALSF